MATRPSRPDVLARELGIDFTVEEPAQSKMPVLRFTFKFPSMETQPAEYAEAIARVTLWSKRVAAWTFQQFGPLPIVAAEMTFGNRVKVALYNRKNRKLMAAFNSVESQARRIALSQPTPQQALKVLAEQVPVSREKETRKLRETLERSVAVLEGPDQASAGSVH